MIVVDKSRRGKLGERDNGVGIMDWVFLDGIEGGVKVGGGRVKMCWMEMDREGFGSEDVGM